MKPAVIVAMTVSAILGASMAYLMGAFYSVSFNIAHWTEDTRALTCMLMPFFAALAGGVAANYATPSQY